MKTNKILKIGLMAVGFMALFAVTFILNDFFAGLVSCAGVLLAVPPVAGTVGTPVEGTVTAQAIDEANDGILKDDIVKKIVQIRPSVTPLDTILRSVSAKGKTDSRIVKFFSAGVRDVVTTLKDGVAATTGSPANKVHQITLSNESFAAPDDVLMFKEVNGSDGRMLVAHVIAAGPTPGTYNVMMLNGTGTAERDTPAIPEGTEVVRLSTAMNERDARNSDFAIIPDDDFNYTQIIMSTITQGLYAKILAKEVDFDLTDLKDSAVYDFRRKCEGALLWGKRAEMIRPSDGRKYYHMGGIARKISENSMTFQSSAKASDVVVDWTKHIFCGNNGSDTRIAFAGDDILEWLDKRLLGESNKNINAKDTEVVAGITFNKIQTNFGKLLVHSHGDFRTYGMSKKMMVIDPEYIELRTLLPMGIREIDNDAVGTERSKSYVISEDFTNIVTNLATHAMITMNV